MKLADLPDDFTPEQFRQLDKESLDAIPFVRRRWLCQCKGCTRGTHVRDYGLEEFNPRGIWALLDRNSQDAAKHPDRYWMGPNNYWLCGRHDALFKRMRGKFDFEHVWRRFIDPEKIVVVDCPGETNGIIKRIESR